MSPLALALALVCMSAGAANSGSGDLDSGGSKTDITGLRLEDVVEDMRGALGKSAHSLRVSNVPLQEVVKIQTELHQNMNKKVPEDRRWVESGNLASFNGMSPEPYLTVTSALPCSYPRPKPVPLCPRRKIPSFLSELWLNPSMPPDPSRRSAESPGRLATKTCRDNQDPPCMQPRGKTIVSLVNSYTNATSKRWHLWEIDLRFAPGLSPRW